MAKNGEIVEIVTDLIFWAPKSLQMVTAAMKLNSSVGKSSACNVGDPGSIPGSGRSPGEGNSNTPVFLPGESHGQRSLTGYSPWDSKSQTRLSN